MLSGEIVSIHTLHYPDASSRLLDAHRTVTSHFGVRVHYSKVSMHHGDWMDQTINDSRAQVVGFLDSDCVPMHKDAVDSAIDYCLTEESFVGVAQASNHLPTKDEIFAAPAFLFIHRNAYRRLGKPSLRHDYEIDYVDAAQRLTRTANSVRMAYKLLFPTHFQRPPADGIWRLGNRGYFGIGTIYDGGVYHLYQGRRHDNIELFERTCIEIMNGSFNKHGLIRSDTLEEE